MIYKNAIVTVCYNHLDVTKKFLDSLVQEFDNTYGDKPSNYDLFILDNGSTDGTYKYLKEFQEYKHKFEVHVYKSDSNLGFGGGNNLLLKEILKANIYKTVILLNNDTLINKNALDLLVEVNAKDPLVAATGPMSNYIWGRQQINIKGITPQNYTQYANQLAGADNIHAEEVAFLAGFCLCIKTPILEKIGLFDEQFAIGNYEDNDYCLRIRNAGYKLVMVKEALIYHFGSQTIRDFNPAQLLNKNRALFIRKHRGVKEDDNVMISQLVISPRHKPNYFFQDIPSFHYTGTIDTLPQDLLKKIYDASKWVFILDGNDRAIHFDLTKLVYAAYFASPDKDLLRFKVVHIKDGKVDLTRGADWQGRLLRLRKRADGTIITPLEVPSDAIDYTCNTIVSYDNVNDHYEPVIQHLSISAALIVKNEEKYIKTCMESLQDFADEIIVVDTGSTDKTKEICSNYGALITDYKWDDSFANARNFCLDHCTKSWIIRVDGDEALPLMTKVNIYNAIVNNEADAFLVPIQNIQPNGTYELSSTIRVFKNNPKYRYTGRVHEEIDESLKQAKAKVLKINNPFIHYGYLKGIQDQKSAFYLHLLKLDYADNPNNFKTNMNLANYYYHHNNYETAIEFYKDAVRLLNGHVDPIIYHDYAITKYRIFLQKHQEELKEIVGILDKVMGATQTCYPEQIERFKKNYNAIKSLILK